MMRINKNLEIINSQDVKDVYNFVNNRISCKTHLNQPAKSICMDCKTFCCMMDNCGQPHIYHSIENLEYLVNSQITPFLNNLKEVNSNLSNNKTTQLTQVNSFKNNLKSFAVAEKKKIDEEYRQIINSIQIIYNSNMQDINEFIDYLNEKFDDLQAKINQVYISGNLSQNPVQEINEYMKNILINSNSNNEIFISNFAKDFKNLNQKLKSVHSQLTKFDFEKEIGELKIFAEKEYPKIDKNEYFKSLNKKIENEKNTYLESKKKKEERKSISKIKRIVSLRQTINPKDNFNLEIDLDIFVRYLFDEVNKIRQNPKEVLKILDEYVDIINNDESFFSPTNQSMLNETNININMNSKLSFLYEYINLLINKKISLPIFEWDNDLSNSAEDYLKATGGKLEKDSLTLTNHMKEIIVNNYYSQYTNINCVTYNGAAEMNKIIMNILLNESYWDNSIKQNIIFHNGFNVAGICGVGAIGTNRVILILNFSNLNK